MISVQNLRNGTYFEEQGQMYQVLSYEHIKMGRGSATIKVKIKNVRSGATTEKSFINSAKVKDIQILKKNLQYLYKDDDQAYFMDPQTYEQSTIGLKVIPEHKFLKEGETFTLSFHGTEPLELNLPPKMDFMVTETGPSLRGNSATNIYKDAILENGIKTRVPLFIDSGDKIKIDTRTGEYSEKV